MLRKSILRNSEGVRKKRAKYNHEANEKVSLQNREYEFNRDMNVQWLDEKLLIYTSYPAQLRYFIKNW